jgi:NAD(P)-dependent dehydrogenase (short-subunit alcohol dehydrogenase family)
MASSDFTLDFFSLRGKRAIVTGGNTGLGQAFALAPREGRRDVFVPSLLDDEGVTAGLIEAEGVRHASMQVDITEPGAPERVVDACVEQLGSVDILINSAGHRSACGRARLRPPLWDATVAVNLTAAFEMSYEAAQRMVPQRSGKIINICSVFSFLGGRRHRRTRQRSTASPGLTKTYCDELAQHNIQVNGIAPGYYATELTAATASDPGAEQRVLDHIPTGRWGEPLDLMGAVVFLASRASDYVNGHVLSVDGGYLVR